MASGTVNYVVRVWVSSFLNMSKPLQHNLCYCASLAICHFANLSRRVHTNAFSKVVLFFFDNASINSRPHYRFDAFSTVLTKMFENDRIARCDVS